MSWKNKCIAVVVLGLFFTLTLTVGCEEYLLGAGAGIAGKQTLESWQQNLEAKKSELAARYEAVVKELETAPDPNAIIAAKEKLRAIQDQQLANEAAMLTVRKILEVPKLEGASKQNRELWFGGLIAEALGIAYLAWSKRKVGQKYIAHKAGQAKFAESAPEAAASLYSAIGVERTARGL